MSRLVRTATGVALGALTAVAPVAHAASAVPLVYVTGPQSSNGWTIPAFAVPQGASLTFANADSARHDFVAEEYGADTQPWCTAFSPGQCPLFFSKFAGLGQTVPVDGLDNLVAGQSYTFLCIIHPLMRGTLVALPPLPA
jgi:plastocyanin